MLTTHWAIPLLNYCNKSRVLTGGAIGWCGRAAVRSRKGGIRAHPGFKGGALG